MDLLIDLWQCAPKQIRLITAMIRSAEEIGNEESGEHRSLDRRFFVAFGKEIFMDSKGKFAQGIHRLVCVFTEKTAVIFRKSNIQNPVHGLDFPMLPSKFHQLFGRGIPAGNVITGLPAVMPASLHNPLNRENRLQAICALSARKYP